MKRMVCLAIVFVIASRGIAAAKPKPRGCAIFVSTDGTTVFDPAHASCQAGGKLAVVFCNDDTKNPHTFKLLKDMRTGGKTYAVLKADVVMGPVPKNKCDLARGDFNDDTVFGVSIPYAYFEYTLMMDSLFFDPDLDVSPPTGIEIKGAARGKGAR